MPPACYATAVAPAQRGCFPGLFLLHASIAFLSCRANSGCPIWDRHFAQSYRCSIACSVNPACDTALQVSFTACASSSQSRLSHTAFVNSKMAGPTHVRGIALLLKSGQIKLPSINCCKLMVHTECNKVNLSCQRKNSCGECGNVRGIHLYKKMARTNPAICDAALLSRFQYSRRSHRGLSCHQLLRVSAWRFAQAPQLPVVNGFQHLAQTRFFLPSEPPRARPAFQGFPVGRFLAVPLLSTGPPSNSRPIPCHAVLFHSSCTECARCTNTHLHGPWLSPLKGPTSLMGCQTRL